MSSSSRTPRSAPHDSLAVAEPPCAWVMLAIGTVLVALNLGALSTLSVFLEPISEEFAWPRGATALAYTIAALTIGVAVVGAVVQPITLWLLSGLGSLPAFYGFYILLGGLGFAAVKLPIIANVGLWFSRRRGTALGILSAGGPLGQARSFRRASPRRRSRWS